jgi:hypothetical protein
LIHFIALFLSTVILNADSIYEIQLYATKVSTDRGIDEMLQKGRNIGLECSTVQEDRTDGRYFFVRCGKANSYKEIKKSIKKAKLAKLDYFYLKYDDSEKVYKKKPVSQNNSYAFPLFGKNEELMQILYNKKSISKDELARRKEIYLKSIASSESFNGLYLKGGASNNFGIDRHNYNIRLQWNIFGDGYLESQSDMKKILIKKELEYEQIMDEYQRLNLELSLYKIHAIDNYINHYFLKEQKNILAKIEERSKKRLDASLITSEIFFKRKKRYEDIKQKLFYYDSLEKEPCDVSLKPIISTIEDIEIADKRGLAQYAYLHSYELKNRQKKIELSNMDDNWLKRLRTNLYVEKKKVVYLDDLDTVAGFQVQLPLDFDKDDKYKDIEVETSKVEAQLLKKLIDKNVDEIYRKIDYHKNHINILKSDITSLEDETKVLQIKEDYPFGKQNRDPIYEREMLKVSVSKHKQEIWQERLAIMKLLLKLQNLTGVQVLPPR